MAKKKEPTVEKKLRALYDLQLIDSRIDEIVSLRGELPLEVDDLENEIKDLKTKADKIKEIVEENVKNDNIYKKIFDDWKEAILVFNEYHKYSDNEYLKLRLNNT